MNAIYVSSTSVNADADLQRSICDHRKDDVLYSPLEFPFCGIECALFIVIY